MSLIDYIILITHTYMCNIYILKKFYDLFKHHVIYKVSFLGFGSLWWILTILFITLNMSPKILVKEFSLWANYISSYCYSQMFKHFQHSSEAWHTKWKLKFHMWIWLQMSNCYCLGSFLYFGPLLLYISHTEANIWRNVHFIFVTAWWKRRVEPGVGKEHLLIQEKPSVNKNVGTDKGWDLAHWRTREAHGLREKPLESWS